MQRFFLLCTVCLMIGRLSSQVTVGSSIPPEPFSILQIEGNESGVRLPRLSTMERDNLVPDLTGNPKATGLLIYNTNLKQLNYWDGTRWVNLPVTLAENGIELVQPLKLQLGGSLIHDTHINLQDQALRFNTTTGKFVVNTNTLVITGDKGVAIGTDNPLGVFHIDAGKDNSATPTPLELENDIIIDSNGKMSIGKSPDSMDVSLLQINGPLTIKAGETPLAGTDYILATKDGTGQAKWIRNAASIPPIVFGQYGGTDGETDGLTEVIGNSNVGKYIGCRITLPPGKWAVQTVLLIRTGTLPNNRFVQVSIAWGESRNTQNISPDVQSGSYIQGNIIQGGNGIANGITVIKNSTQSPKTYYLNIKDIRHNTSGISWDKVGSNRWGENSIIAHPYLFSD